MSANGLNVYILYFNMAATQKFSCRNLVGPSFSRPNLVRFGLVWSNKIAGKMYPEMDIYRTVYVGRIRLRIRPHKNSKCHNHAFALSPAQTKH